MSLLDISGTLVPLVTPFTDDLSTVSEVRLARIIRSLMPKNPAGFLVCGDLGEFAFLTSSERKQVLEIVMRETGNAVPVVVNATTVGTMAALDLAQHAKRHGARAVVVMPPFYGTFTTDEMLHHFRLITKHSDQLVLVVDPQLGLEEEVERELRPNPTVGFAQPLSAPLAISDRATTDEFEYDHAKSSPVALLEYDDFAHGPGNRAAILASAMRENGKVRVAKAMLQFRDIEAGPPRNPYQMSSVDVVREVQQAMDSSD